MNINEMRLGQLKDEDATYDNLVMYLVYKGFDILFMHQDTRQDDGDDGGYQITISKKGELYYVHILRANYNVSVGGNIITPDDERLETEDDSYADFVELPTFEECKIYIQEFVSTLDEFINLPDFDGRDKEDFLDYNHNLTRQQAEFLATCYFPYSEYAEQDRRALTEIKEL